MNIRGLLCQFWDSLKGGIDTIMPLLRIAPYKARKEKPLRAFTDETELHIENGVKIFTTYNNIEGWKAMLRLLSWQLNKRQRVNLSSDGN